MTRKEEIRREVIHELERSIIAFHNEDGSYSVNIGNGAIKFTIRSYLQEADGNTSKGSGTEPIKPL